jgi:hypothetical protein
MEMLCSEHLIRMALQQDSLQSEVVEKDCNVATMDLNENTTK